MKSLSLIAAAVVLAGAGLGPGVGDANAQRDRDLITREELVQSAQKSADLYKAIRSLRPHFLQGGRGVRSMDVGTMGRDREGVMRASGTARGGEPTEPVIYIDGNRAGSVDILKTIETGSIAEVRYLSPTQALNDKGPGHEGGALLITRHREP